MAKITEIKCSKNIMFCNVKLKIIRVKYKIIVNIRYT
jgi:hypothetical protein